MDAEEGMLTLKDNEDEEDFEEEGDDEEDDDEGKEKEEEGATKPEEPEGGGGGEGGGPAMMVLTPEERTDLIKHELIETEKKYVSYLKILIEARARPTPPPLFQNKPPNQIPHILFVVLKNRSSKHPCN